MPKPNILWICSDQQRVDTLGAYGNPFVRTPNLDRLAETGTLFLNAFSQSPVCTPSRATFLTGRYPRTCRTRQNGADIPADEVLVTKMLADAGYTCGLAGKLHLSACSPSVCTTMERRIDDGYHAFHWSHHAGPGWGMHNEYWAWLDAQGAHFETPPRDDCPYVLEGMPSDRHQTTWCAEKACDFMTEHADDEAPWLFSVNFFDPHHAFDPPAEYLAPYLARLDAIPLPNYVEGELAGKPPFQQEDHEGAYGGFAGFAFEAMSERDHRMVRAAYWAMCDLIDEQVGRMLDTLEATGQLENTLVIYTSDHGEMLGDHGIYLKGPFFYEPAIHVPLIIAGPGAVEAQTSPALVELTDLPQTILDAAGLAHHAGMQGRSLWPLLTGGADADHHRDNVYAEYYNAMPWHRNPTAQMTMVRTAAHKLVMDHAHNTGELYDLEADPTETHNCWGDPDYAGVQMAMLQRLCNRMAWTVDPLPLRRAPW
jgi:arylsulfatase A-like enzyme